MECDAAACCLLSAMATGYCFSDPPLYSRKDILFLVSSPCFLIFVKLTENLYQFPDQKEESRSLFFLCLHLHEAVDPRNSIFTATCCFRGGRIASVSK
jgi:hypothetical protein